MTEPTMMMASGQVPGSRRQAVVPRMIRLQVAVEQYGVAPSVKALQMKIWRYNARLNQGHPERIRTAYGLVAECDLARLVRR